MGEFFKTKLETEVQQEGILVQKRKVIWVKFGTLKDKDKIMEHKRDLDRNQFTLNMIGQGKRDKFKGKSCDMPSS